MRLHVRSAAVAVLLVLLAGTTGAGRISQTVAAPAPVVVPFELVLYHIFLPVTVNGSRPLAFVLDTGDKFGIVDLDRAKQLSLTLGNEIKVGGAGADLLTGALVKDATFALPKLAGFSQPIVLALPLKNLAYRLGQDFDGIIGADFIRQFVVEIDYQAQTITFHPKDTFTYSGPGEAVPLHFNALGHPIADVEVTPTGGTPIPAKCVLDIGSGATVVLHTPFVTEHRLPGDGPSIRAVGLGGAGGAISGRIGRIGSIKIGSFVVRAPRTIFAQDKAGAFSSTDIQGNIGARILSRFRVFLDYGRNRMILEPTKSVDAPFDTPMSGISVQTEGSDYRTFRITDVLEDSPASAAGIRANDIIVAVDDKSAGDWTLSTLTNRLEQPGPCRLTLRRGSDTVTVTVTPANLV